MQQARLVGLHRDDIIVQRQTGIRCHSRKPRGTLNDLSINENVGRVGDHATIKVFQNGITLSQRHWQAVLLQDIVTGCCEK